MRLCRSIALPGLGIGLMIATVFPLNGEASAQTDMNSMPGMTPAATSTPEPSASPTPKPTPSDAAVPQQDMESMPGMTPARKETSGMQEMPGMKADGQSKKTEMSAMPGMGGSEKKATGAMPGMAGDASAPQRLSAPGIFVLRPPQKWTPPPGDHRSGELLSREELERQMQPLPSPLGDSKLYSFSLFDLLEYRYNSAGPDTFVWDFVGWSGGNYNRLWVKTEGRQALSQGGRGEGDLQLLYGRLVSPFWDFQIGVRTLTNLGNGSLRRNARSYAVIGFQGLAPGNFDVEPALYISDRGEVSGEITITADVYLTQRLIIQPRFQGEITVQGDPRFNTGSGGSTIDMGVRLRYDIRREIQPYVGVSWLRSFGANARLTREAGETNDTIGLAVGLQLWW